MIDSAFDMLRPERLGIDSQLETAIGVLNDWATNCGSALGSFELSSAQRDELARYVPAETLQRVASERFTNRDGLHIRDCLLWKVTNTFAVHNAEDDVSRIVELFHYVVRNIALDEPQDDPLYLSPFEAMVFGRGSAEDRAWVFAEMLRQLRIDTVILRAPGEAPEGAKGPHWLIGVLLDNNVYLFEPHLGTPVPSLADNAAGATVRKPATLEEAVGNDAVLRQLDRSAEQPYPLKTADLQKLRVEVVGSLSFWSPRMRRLQQSLSGDRSVIIYDSLEDTDAGPGLISRVADFGKECWTRDDVAVWEYPEKALQATEDRGQRETERLFVLLAPFGWPAEVVQDPQTQQIRFGRPKRDQLKIRLNQITGDFGKTIHFYNGQMASIETQMRADNIALPPDFQIPPEVRRVHARAAEDAMYFIAVCQFETGEYRAASEKFMDYLSTYREGGLWSPQARFLRAWSLAELGEFDVAARLLEQAPSTDPQAAGYGVFIRRWKAQAPGAQPASSGEAQAGSEDGAGKAADEKSAEPNDSKPETSPSDPPPAEAGGGDSSGTQSGNEAGNGESSEAPPAADAPAVEAPEQQNSDLPQAGENPSG